jgi:hypothetical protein
MVTGGGSSSPETVCPRSGGIACVFAKETFACLKSVMAAPLRRVEPVVVLGMN